MILSTFFFFPFFGTEQAGCAGHLSSEPVSGMERDWMDRRAGVGGEERCAGGGEVGSASFFARIYAYPHWMRRERGLL
jgi:hypothetical protein